MGNVLSGAVEAEDIEAKAKNQALFKALENKLEAMKLKIEKTRGSAEGVKDTQIAGGRTAQQVTEIRVSNSSKVDAQIMDGIHDFLSIATGSPPSVAAVSGATKLLKAGVKHVLGASNGESREKTSFQVLFLGNAFARIDYSIYCYNVSASKFGQNNDETGMCYIADVAILDNTEVTPEEASYLISNSFDTKDTDDAKAVGEMMLNVALLQRLQKVLMDESKNMADLKETIKEYRETQKLIQQSQKDMKKYQRSAPAEGGETAEIVATVAE